ncbi:MAG TPA: Gfo/Idh/MocA family oxidoreductase [Acidimicrobiia bacterium]|nr:Gfo/Idh/MocA family oxidoreductase [Acidimicrobiia bacterium]
MADRIGLASIGVGWWGSQLAERLGEDASVVACYARNQEKREDFASRFECDPASSLDQVLDNPAVAGLLVATSHSTHREIIEAAATAGKHVFVEKPLTLNLADARAAVAAAEKAGIVLQVGHQRRRAAGIRRLRALVTEGVLGEVQVLASHHHSPNGLRMPAEAWRRKPEESPLGSMTSLAVHTLDTFNYLGGPLRRVYAATRPARPGGTIDEATALTVEFESGVLGSILTSFYVPPLVELSVHGSGGAAFSRDDARRLTLTRLDPPGEEELALTPVDPVADQLQEFVASIRGDSVPETGGAEGLAVVAALEAAVESARSGSAVEVVV